MMFITLGLTKGWSVSLRFFKTPIGGNQYAYEGNQYAKNTYQANSVEEALEQTIMNQEQGRSPMEFYNPLSRAKRKKAND
jgi:hypothetical protein